MAATMSLTFIVISAVSGLATVLLAELAVAAGDKVRTLGSAHLAE